MKYLTALLCQLLVTVSACADEEDALPRWQTLDTTTTLPAATPERIALISSGTPPGEDRALEIGIVVLDSGIEGDSLENRREGVFPEVREAETRYLPFALRRTLVDSNQWGAVRVLPNRDPGYELLISGEIIESNGAELALKLTAIDASDRVWLDQTYTAVAEERAYQEAERRQRRPFQSLYNQFANDLLTIREGYSDRELRRLRELSTLRYAGALLPEAFNEFIRRDESGVYSLQRLPARGDPMLARILRVREQEYIFIDTTDEQYADLFTEMTPVYDLWRQFLREQLAYREAWEERIAERDTPKSGTYLSMKQRYNNYKWKKIQRQEMRILADGFNNEVAPTTLQLEGNVVKLSGSVDQRYREWRDILRQIYQLETGE
ncbi:MAG: hypothetical protein AAGI24_06335 [Pseudomonadota bacterium]